MHDVAAGGLAVARSNDEDAAGAAPVATDVARGAAPLPLPTPIVFGDGRLFGFHHAPEAKRARAAAAVLCNPLGYEAMCVHRTYRHLAERLARSGFHVLRFDHHGCGDSSGHGDEPGRWRTWVEGIGVAIDEACSLSGASAVDLFGLRLGATLAVGAAQGRSDVRSLVLWAPVVSGRRFVRELRARSLLLRDPAVAADETVDGEEVLGYRFDAQTLALLSDLELCAERPPRAARAMVLGRDELADAETRLARHLRGADVETLLDGGVGFTAMTRDPQDAVVPSATLDAIVRWVAAARDERPIEPRARPRPAAPLRAASKATGLPVRERGLRFGPGQRLFGIVTVAERPLRAGPHPAVVFLNVGANHHVGPARMYVTLARDLAAQGYTCLRFDLGGIGDSRAAPGGRDNPVYAPTSIDDVAAAISCLHAVHGVSHVVLVGLCSGAHLAFHTAERDDRVVGQVLINPPRLEQRENESLELLRRRSRKSTRYYLRALRDPRVWRDAVHGKVDVRVVLETFGERLLSRAAAAGVDAFARLRGESLPPTEVARSMSSMVDRGVATLFLYGSEDGGLDSIESHFGRDASRLRHARRVSLEILEGADHTFTPAVARRELFRRIVGYFTREFP